MKPVIEVNWEKNLQGEVTPLISNIFFICGIQNMCMPTQCMPPGGGGTGGAQPPTIMPHMNRDGN